MSQGHTEGSGERWGNMEKGEMRGEGGMATEERSEGKRTTRNSNEMKSNDDIVVH